MIELNKLLETIFEFNGNLADVHFEDDTFDTRMDAIVKLNTDNKTIELHAHFGKLAHAIDIDRITTFKVEYDVQFDEHTDKLTSRKLLKIIYK